ncbi:LuxR C-terminal-related transcriptional regulator [Hymenobacter fodinae]|uniref:LuxR C-terminal-related transcriptional regulator n=1 Tax=Hymenobacter fodinae TaxID=2510796 RepID=UPI001AEC4765|nr:response regulator transcription factor [Hymenobacter fodinae]
MASLPTVQLVGQVRTEQELLEQLPHTPTDIVLLSSTRGEGETHPLLRYLRQQYPSLAVLVVCAEADVTLAGDLFRAGAAGVLLPTASAEELTLALHLITMGRPYLPAEVGLLALHAAGPAPSARPTPTCLVSPAVRLSQREREIVQLLAQGLTTSEVAAQLCTSKRTVDSQRQQLLEKTGSRNSAALIRYVLEWGFIT